MFVFFPVVIIMGTRRSGKTIRAFESLFVKGLKRFMTFADCRLCRRYESGHVRRGVR